MIHPLVSIITPTYNHERFIGACIESAMSQDYPHWEMIIINDGSTDNTAETVASFKDSRIRCFHQAHRGIWSLSETYNFALEKARGDLIAVLEGDDCWPKNRLAKQVPHLVDTDAVLCYGRFLRIDQNGQLLDPISSDCSNVVTVQTPQEVLKGLLLGKLTIMPVTVLVKRQSLEDIGGFQQPSYYPAVEHPTWLNLGQKGPFLYLDWVLGYWRRHSGQASGDLGLELSRGLLDYNVEFFKCLDQTSRDQLCITRKHLQRRESLRMAAAFFSKGRYQLIENNRAGAKQSFLSALKAGGLTTKLKALVALFVLKTRLDLESLIAASGRGRYK